MHHHTLTPHCLTLRERRRRSPRAIARALCLLACLLCFGGNSRGATTLPAGFVEETIGGTWNEAIGLTFAADGRMFVWERGGRVWVVQNGVKAATPLLDISEEVGSWHDHGLAGFALDPDFLNNGFLYLLYVVDHHHVANFGTPAYDPAANEYNRATIGRLTRYTVRASDGLIDSASRRVLVGETVTNGFPILFTSHGLGSLVFGEDGTLLVSCGDGGSSTSTDLGSAAETYFQQALAEGIIQPRENVGTFRAQLTSTLAGKIVRLDPATGDGVPGNPYFDPAQPRSARSRLWAMGLRNPFRMTLRPGTGSHRVTDGNPGVLLIGDVGYLTWEELDVCTRPGMNFGWPIYEGMDLQPAYSGTGVLNQDAPNPLFGAGCSQPYFAFRDLLKQATLGTVSWPNPCSVSNAIPASIPRFMHSRPAIDWKQGSGPSRVGIYNGTNAATINVGASGSPVTGPQFGGNCSIGGVWYSGSDFPAQYKNTYFHGEYGALWIKNIQLDSNNAPVAVRDFASNAGGIVSLATHPLDGGLYYINWTTTLKRIRYVAGSNQPPAAVISLDQNYGPSPLTVQFSGTNSTDPEGFPLAYQWNFGDGTPLVTNASPSHIFNAPAGIPTRFDVKLRVTDRSGASSTNTAVVSVNNSPPQVTILSPADGGFYPMSGETVYPCTALVSDAEQDSSQLSCTWQTILHHNNHTHSEPVDTNCATTTVLSPLGCNGETYFYRVVLTVTDAAGLSTTRESRLYPYCTNLVPAISWTNPASILEGTALSGVQLNATANIPGSFVYQPPLGTVLPPAANQVLSVTFTPDNRSNYVVATAKVNITVQPPFPGARINFQPASSPVPAGYSVDSGLVYGPRTNGLTYGWDLDNSSNTKDRDSALSPDQRYDTYIASQKSGNGSIWQIAVPNDIYSVQLVAGDANNFDSLYKYKVENTLALSGTPTTSNRWIFGAATVTVSDGLLTVSNGPGSLNNKLCFIDITRHGPLLACAPDATVEYGVPWTFTAPSGTPDSCSASNVSIALLGTVTNRTGRSQNTLSATRSWRATDTCGNTSDCSQTITVVDTTPPALTCASNRTVACGAGWNFDFPAAFDQADGTNVTIAILGTSTNVSCALGFQATRIWRATDLQGNSTDCSQTVSIPPPTTLALTCHPNRSVEFGAAWSFEAPAPPNAGCIGSTPVISVIATLTNAPVANEVLSVTRSWQATDTCSNLAICSQTISIVDTTPPSLICATNKTVACGAAWNFDAPSAVDLVDGANVTITIIETSTNISCALGMRATRTWRATDSRGNSASCSQAITVAPSATVVLVCASNRSAEYGSAWSFDMPTGSSDSCITTNLTISVAGTITNAAALSNQVLRVTRTWQAMDACSNLAICSQTISIVDTTPPSLICGSNRTVACGATWNFDAPSAVDLVDGANAAIAVVETSTNTSCALGMRATRTWRATDSRGNSASCSQTITVAPSATVVLVCASNRSVEYGSPLIFDMPSGSSDSCITTNLTISVAGTITNAAAFSNQVLSVTRTWQAMDACSNRATCSQTISVVDTTAPSLTCANNKTIRCGTAWEFDSPSAVDVLDGTNVTIVILNTLTNRSCSEGFQATRTWRARDSHGNTAQCSQTVFAPPQASIAGSIWFATNYPATPSDRRVPGVTIAAAGATNAFDETGIDGSYEFVLDAGGGLQVTPSYTNSAAPAAGVTTVDLSLIRRHILNITPLDSPYKLIAADVNASDSVTTLDISIIRRMILGTIDTFPAGRWRFVPADYVFLDPTKPWDAPVHRSYTNLAGNLANQDFVAIKLGDVNNSWSPPLTASKMIRAPENFLRAAWQPVPEVSFQIQCHDIRPGGRLTARVTATGLEEMTSAQFTVAWDPAVLKFEGLSGYGLRGLADDNFGVADIARGKLTFSWDDPAGSGVSLEEDETVFAVTFSAVGSEGASSRLALVDDIAVREAGVGFKAARFRAQNGQVTLRGVRSLAAGK